MKTKLILNPVCYIILMMNPLLELFLVFLKIGITTFGGGYAMISVVKEEVVDKRKWITNEELLNLLAVAESTPGPIAINMATFVGFQKKKTIGAIVATFAVVLPSFLIILGLTFVFNSLFSNQYVQYAFFGIKIAVAFLILRSAYKLLKETKLNWWQLIIFVLVFGFATLIDLLSWSFSTIFLLIISGLLGYFINSLSNRKRSKK